ncbi:MAG: 4-(cytidine 5'-diphospho)-2-C-methyl-D-erythritol kinase [Verrucomicrobia bacterium]|nr:MAG: 4-(cytidine 5'-diphospho)-2-C-methyl-D-erythritol kinase [Verrucomicrobiota bacterium]
MMKMKLSPPAKINLSLRILGKRQDGYHEIETLMTFVTLEDSLELELISEGKVTLECEGQEAPSDHTNLAVIAANAYLQEAGLKSGVKIFLEKHIPSGAGLGGGSSDAASVLRGLDALHDGRIGRASLSSIAAKIGSDVPFFLGYAAAWCRGRGEVCEPVSFSGFDRSVLLVKPPFSVSTNWAYSRLENAKKIPGLPYDSQSSPWGDLSNDLEVPVFEKFPLLGIIKRWLLERVEVEVALMSGSGSTIFAILREAEAADHLMIRIRSLFGSQTWVSSCKTQFMHL